MPKMTVEMSDNELCEAVVEWAKTHHGMTVDPTRVMMTVQEAWRGHGPMEEKYHRPVVKFETE